MINDTHCTTYTQTKNEQHATSTTKFNVTKGQTWHVERGEDSYILQYVHTVQARVSVVPHSNVGEGVDRSAKALQ